jgi:3-phosphoshikimate 1-carboxyvinyltransferase
MVVGGWKIDPIGENAEESPYLVMTFNLLAQFSKYTAIYSIEPDASSASYFWAAKWLSNPASSENEFRINGWENLTTSQVDIEFPTILIQLVDTRKRRDQVSRQLELGDSIMTLVVLSPLFQALTKFENLGNLRRQETERVVALRTELTKCGAKVVEEGDTLTVWPSPLHGAEIETYNDHRMAMCFAVLGLKVPGIKIKNPACVKKTFPNFFQKLAAQPPHGLGAEIWEIKDGQRTRKLGGEDLFAD